MTAQELGGVRLVVGLLSRPEENLRLLGLRLLLSFVPLLPAEPPAPQQDGAQAGWTINSPRCICCLCR